MSKAGRILALWSSEYRGSHAQRARRHTVLIGRLAVHACRNAVGEACEQFLEGAHAGRMEKVACEPGLGEGLTEDGAPGRACKGRALRWGAMAATQEEWPEFAP